MLIKSLLLYLKQTLIDGWERPNWLTYCLLPVSVLTYFVTKIKTYLYVFGIKKTHYLNVPVIVVGNIYIGGTGKTPFIIELVSKLKERGWTPGVISRGYGTQVTKQPHCSNVRNDPAYLGDEAALIHQRTGVPVCIHPKRVLAANKLLEITPEVDVIISDDGLQHLSLGRKINIVIQDKRGLGNGWLLPAGPLRETSSRLKTVDLVITNQGHSKPFTNASQPTIPLSNQPPSPLMIDMFLSTSFATQLISGQICSLSEFQHRSIAAVCGIGYPQRFFNTLKAHDLKLDTQIGFDDHYPFQESSFDGISQEIILITEKDAVKCQHIHDSRIWVVALDVILSNPHIYHWLEDTLHG